MHPRLDRIEIGTYLRQIGLFLLLVSALQLEVRGEGERTTGGRSLLFYFFRNGSRMDLDRCTQLSASLTRSLDPRSAVPRDPERIRIALELIELATVIEMASDVVYRSGWILTSMKARNEGGIVPREVEVFDHMYGPLFGVTNGTTKTLREGAAALLSPERGDPGVMLRDLRVEVEKATSLIEEAGKILDDATAGGGG